MSAPVPRPEPVHPPVVRFPPGLLCFLLLAGAARAETFPVPRIPYAPRVYDCPRATAPLVIDGRLDDDAWKTAPETGPFVDIEGDLKPAPRFATRARMLWDDRFFYVGAALEEPDLWATLTERDAVIFRDHDFEVFIDPDADTCEYYELEVNTRGTVWDLLLVRPYRDGGPAVNAWDIRGLQSAVFLEGTLNDPSDRDRGWSVELAFPWSVLGECAHRPAPPKEGDCWKVNFSRVEWRLETRQGRSEKAVDPATGKPFPEDNWVWSPQGLVNMHYPEMWGWVRFTSGAPSVPFRVPGDEERWALRLVYYGEKELFGREGRYSALLEEIGLSPAGAGDLPGAVGAEGATGTAGAGTGGALGTAGVTGASGTMGAGGPGGMPGARPAGWPPAIQTTDRLFQARLRAPERGGSWLITQEGRILFEAEPSGEAR